MHFYSALLQRIKTSSSFYNAMDLQLKKVQPKIIVCHGSKRSRLLYSVLGRNNRICMVNYFPIKAEAYNVKVLLSYVILNLLDFFLFIFN